MVDEQRIKSIAASLSFSPLPRDTTEWMHEPALRLLTDDESDGVASILEKLQDTPSDMSISTPLPNSSFFEFLLRASDMSTLTPLLNSSFS